MAPIQSYIQLGKLTKLLFPFPSSIKFRVYVLFASSSAYWPHSSIREVYFSINSWISSGFTSEESRPELGPRAALRSDTRVSKEGLVVLFARYGILAWLFSRKGVVGFRRARVWKVRGFEV